MPQAGPLQISPGAAAFYLAFSADPQADQESEPQNEPPKQWAWDLLPLDSASWGNVRTVGETPGAVLALRRWVDQAAEIRRELAKQIAEIAPHATPVVISEPSQPLYRPASGAIPPLFEDGGTRAFYVPTESDLALSAKLLPDKLNPGGVNPNWRTLREALVQKGCEPGRLIQVTPRELLGLLAKHYVTLNGRPRDLELPEEITGELFRLWNSRAVGATRSDIANLYNESPIGKQHSQTFPEVSVDASYVRKAVNAQRSRNRRRPQ